MDRKFVKIAPTQRVAIPRHGIGPWIHGHVQCAVLGLSGLGQGDAPLARQPAQRGLAILAAAIIVVATTLALIFALRPPSAPKKPVSG